ACTVLVDGRSARSCLMVAPQANGRSVTTAEGLPAHDPMLWDVIENAFVEKDAFQCGFCTSGMVICLAELLWRSRTVTPADLTEQLSGQVCRCTGYGALLEAFSEVLRYAGLLQDEGSAPKSVGGGR
ncbi:MAG: (2Fe-2S)-binding protein, partial [Streptosporangiaceae bacterium]